MTLGNKIRKYRTLQDMTQKDLGLKAGFSAATADSRIRKYEKDIMAPKDDIRQKLIEALDVDPSALSDINIESYEDIMQVFFLLEDELGLEIERNDETTSLILKNDNPGHAILLSYLYAWYVQKKNLPDEDTETSFSRIAQQIYWLYSYLACTGLSIPGSRSPSASPQFCPYRVQESCTCFPSTTPFGLALGPDLPRADQLYPGNLRYSAVRILTLLSLLIPAFSLLIPPRILSVPLRRSLECSSTDVLLHPTASVLCFSPGHFRRRTSRLVSCYALFECMAASEPTS